jgi:transcriptional regulator with XRE-family HTH domain
VFSFSLLVLRRRGNVDYNERVGERLRVIRMQRGMSLQDVHRATDGEFKAAVLGAYERGERSLSVPRLRRLAACYGVPMNQLLPEEDTYEVTSRVQGGVTIDLTRVDTLSEGVAALLDRFLQRIQVQRQDFNGRVLTIRGSDVAMLAMLLDITDDELVGELTEGTAAG